MSPWHIDSSSSSIGEGKFIKYLNKKHKKHIKVQYNSRSKEDVEMFGCVVLSPVPFGLVSFDLVVFRFFSLFLVLFSFGFSPQFSLYVVFSFIYNMSVQQLHMHTPLVNKNVVVLYFVLKCGKILKKIWVNGESHYKLFLFLL